MKAGGSLELYLLRHGIADEPGLGTRDADRELTAEGRKKLRQVFKVALDAEARPTLIVSSPYVRARQTAQLAAKQLGCEQEIVLSNALVPNAHPHEVWEEIRVYKNEAKLLLASHEPLLSSTAAFLLNSPALLVDFKKGAIMRIDLDGFTAQPRGVLKWYLTPRLAV